MDKQLLREMISELVTQNSLNETATTYGDASKWEALLFPLIKKIYPNSLVEQIASVQPTPTPQAKISYLNSIYTGDKSHVDNMVHWTNSRLLTIPASADSLITVGNEYTITGSNVTVKVFYKEMAYAIQTTTTSAGLAETTAVSSVPKYTHLLVASVSGSLIVDSSTFYPLNPIMNVAAGNTIGGATILYVTANKNTIKKVFKDYSTVLETNTDIKEVNFETATKIIQTKSRKIRSKFSQEKLQDLLAIYKEKAHEIVSESVSNEIRQEIDREIIQFLKDASTPMKSDINLPLSLGMQSGLDAITYDLYASIMLAGEEIVKATKRNRTMFVLADSATCAFLLVNPFHAEAKSEESNPYKVGKIGAYDLFCDPYSTEHYVIVGYNFVSQDKHDAGLYFVPYSTTVHETMSGSEVDMIPFSTNFMVMNRYGYSLHPQDSGTGDGDSDFFRIFAVNFQHNGVVVPNFPEQFRTNY